MRGTHAQYGAGRPDDRESCRASRTPFPVGPCALLAILTFLLTAPCFSQQADLSSIPAQRDSMVASLIAKGESAAQGNRLREALLYYEKALRLDPSNPKALAGRVRSLSQGGGLPQTGAGVMSASTTGAAPDASGGGARVLARADSTDEQDTAAQLTQQYLDKGALALKIGDLATASAAYEEALKIDTNNAKAKNGIEAVKKAEQAQRVKQAEEIAANAARLREAGKLEEAKAELEKARRVAADSRDVAKEAAQIEKAETAAGAAKEKEAKAGERAAAAEKQQRVEALVKEGRALSKEEKYEGAIEKYDLALKEDSENKSALSYKDKAQEAIKARDEARAVQEKEDAERKQQEAEKQRKADTDAKVSVLMAEAGKARKESRFDDAIKGYEQAAQLAPENGKLAGLIQKAGDEKKACEQEKEKKQQEEAARKAQMEREKRVTEILAAAQGLYDQQKFEEAIAQYDLALKEDEQNKTALKNKDKAQKAIEDLKARQEQEKEEQDKQAQAEKERKEKEQADAQRQKAEGIVADAKARYDEGKYEEAIAQCEAALKEDPANKAAQKCQQKARQAVADREASKTLEQEEAKKREQADHDAKVKGLVRQGDKACKESRFDDAVDAYRQAAQLAPDDTRIAEAVEKAKSGKAAFDEEQKKKQEEERIKAEQQTKEEKEKQQAAEKQQRIDGFLSAAQALYKEKNYEETIAQCELALKDEPENTTALKYKDKAQTAKADQEAQARLQEDEAKTLKDKQEAEALVAHAAELREVGKLAEAKAELEKARGLAPDLKDVKKEAGLIEKAEASQQGGGAKDIQLAQAEPAKPQEAPAPNPSENKSEDASVLDKPAAPADQPPSASSSSKDEAEAAAMRAKEKEAEAAVKTEAEKAAAQIKDLLKEAKTAGKKGQYDEAMGLCDQALKLDEASQDAKQLKDNLAGDRAAAEERTKQEGFKARVAEGQKSFKAGDYETALKTAKEVLAQDPANRDATGLAERSQAKIDEGVRQAEASKGKSQMAEADRLFADGLAKYKSGDLLVAEELWKRALAANPEHKDAKTYLEETREQVLARHNQLIAEEKNAVEERKAQEKMNVKVEGLEVPQPTTLVEFFKSLFVFADFNYNIVAGANVMVQGRFNDMRVSEVLDTVLKPRGLKWSRQGNVINIEPDLRTRILSLDDDSLRKVKNLLDEKKLQQTMWPPEGQPPVEGVEIRLDERTGQVIATDSQKNLDRLDTFVKGLKETAPLQYDTKMFRIRPEEGPKIKTLLEAQLGAQDITGAVAAGRKIIIEGEDLIVKDTVENLRKAEQLLNDERLLAGIRTDQIEIGKWNLTPRDVAEKDTEWLQAYFKDVIEVIETMLYSKEGKTAAEEKGRRMWTDPRLLSVTVTDTPENLARINKYIEQLEIVERVQKSEIVFLKYADPTQLSGDLQTVLGISPEAGGAAGGNVWTRTLRTGGRQEEWTGHDFFIRLVRVTENDINDRNDESGEFVIRTNVANNDVTIQEYRTEYITGESGEYEINALEITATGSINEGNARIEVRFTPAAAMPGAAGAAMAPVTPEVAAPPEEISITPFSDKNALLITYTNPTKFTEIMDWIKELDIPELQVSIDTRFVTINETRLKEFGSDFAIANLGKGGLDFSNMNLDVTFREAAGSTFFGQTLLPGQSNFFGIFPETQKITNDWAAAGNPVYNVTDAAGVTQYVPLTGGGIASNAHPLYTSGSPVDWKLHALETEGVLSSVSGPKVTVVNGETATFDIYITFSNVSTTVAGTTTGGTSTTGGTTGAAGRSARTRQDLVLFDVSPLQITPLGAIKLDLNIDMLDPLDSTTANLLTTQYFENELQTRANLQDGDTLVLGGWTRQLDKELSSGFPVLRNLPYVGKLLFARSQSDSNHITLVIFLTANIIR